MKVNCSLVFVFLFLQGFSQNIYKTLLHDKGADVLNDKQVSEITTLITSYTEEGTETVRDITTLNDHHKIVSCIRYNDKDSLKSKLIRSFDETGLKSLSSKRETWNKMLGYSSETSKYQYDQKGNIIKMIESNNFNIIMREVMINNNEKGDPIAISIERPKSKPSGFIEIAEYDYPNNTVITKLLDPEGNILKRDYLSLDGDIIKLEKSYDQQGKLIKPDAYEYEYKYDEKQNWVEKRVYKVENGKRIKHQTFIRTIRYNS